MTEYRKLDLIGLHKKCCVKTKLSDTSTKKIKRMRTQIWHSFGDSYIAMTKPWSFYSTSWYGLEKQKKTAKPNWVF